MMLRARCRRARAAPRAGCDLVVDRVAEAGHAVEHEVPDPQREGEVALERLEQVRVAGRLPGEAVDPLVEAHQPSWSSRRASSSTSSEQRLARPRGLGVHAQRGELRGVALELRADLGDVHDVGGLDGGDERAAAGLHRRRGARAPAASPPRAAASARCRARASARPRAERVPGGRRSVTMRSRSSWYARSATRSRSARAPSAGGRRRCCAWRPAVG